MNARLTRLSAPLGLSCALALSTAACSVPPRTADDQTAAVPLAPARPAPWRVAQMDFGREAYFAACAEPACPARTRKNPPRTQTQQTAVHAAFAAPPASDIEPAAPPAAEVEAAAPQPLPADLPARVQVEETQIFVTFPFGSAALSTAAEDTLRRALPNARGSELIVITGRTDSVGSDEVNQKLALNRALAVRNYLRDALPDLPDVIAIDAKGRCCFVATNDNEGGRSKNRRVEVSFVSSSDRSGAQAPQPLRSWSRPEQLPAPDRSASVAEILDLQAEAKELK